MDMFHRFRDGWKFIFGSSLALALSLPCLAHASVEAWIPAGNMAIGRRDHTATLLPSARVLVTGGRLSNVASTSSVELYDAATNTWFPASSLKTARYEHTATLLPSGKVLVVGGTIGGAGYLASAELYDPSTDTWSAAANLAIPRRHHTATLLPSGRVLVAGGHCGINGHVDAEVYDPTSDTWSSAGRPAAYRTSHTAVLLPNGEVLLAGGSDGNTGSAVSSAELYDPVSNAWRPAASLSIARREHSATLLSSGKVLIAGGATNGGNPCSNCNLASSELYDPIMDSWSPAASMLGTHHWHAAALLPSGKVLLVGGNSAGSAEIYDPGSDAWLPAGALATRREFHTTTLLPSGGVLVAGGGSGSNYLPSGELYQGSVDDWVSASDLGNARFAHSTTLLPSGQVLVAGGYGGSGPMSNAERYDPGKNTWTGSASLGTARDSHTATLLASGKVLVAGGQGSGSIVLGSAESYDPDTDAWSVAGNLTTVRHGHSATLLHSGKVLVAGGYNFGSGSLSSAELYDPSSNSWSAVGSLAGRHYGHTATLLPSGKVLLVGGASNGGFDATGICEIYDPATNAWSAAGSLANPRFLHTATLLPSGMVLVSGGRFSPSVTLSSAELYDPATNSWHAAGTLATARFSHAAVLLRSGQVLIAGGRSEAGYLSSAEMYDPAADRWNAAGNLVASSSRLAATLLLDGRALFSGGGTNANGSSIAQIYSLDFGIADSRRPLITAVGGSLGPGQSLQVTGNRFNGDSEASGGGNRGSPTNSPLLQLRRLDDDHVIWMAPAVDSVRSGTNYRNLPLAELPLGSYALTMFVNGISSVAHVVRHAVHTVSPSAGSNGSIDPATAQSVYEGATTSFSVVPAEHYHVDGVSGCGGSLSGDTYTTGPVIADCVVVATFAVDTHVVTASADANGTIAPDMQIVEHGAAASFLVTPADGYHVASVTGCEGALNGDTYTTEPVTGDCAIVATFASNTYTVTASAGANGTIEPGVQLVEHEATASFLVTPADGYHVASVTGCKGALNGGMYTTAPVTGDCTIVAMFAINAYTVTASADANGTVAPALQTVEHGATASLVVTPASGYHVASIGGTCGGSLAGTVYTTKAIVADCAVAASFAIDEVVSFEITIDDHRSHARYGELLDYIVTVTNSGNGDAIDGAIVNSLPSQLDVANAHWSCLGGSVGVACTESGEGALEDYEVTIPAGGSVTWLVSAPVLLDAAGATVDNLVSVSGGGSAASAIDSDLLVLFLDGFDLANGVHARAVIAACASTTSTMLDVAAGERMVLPMPAAHALIDTVFVARGSASGTVRIDRLNAGPMPGLRWVLAAMNDIERASRWVSAPTDSSLALVTTNGDGSGLSVVGASLPLVAQLPESFPRRLQVEMADGKVCNRGYSAQ